MINGNEDVRKGILNKSKIEINNEVYTILEEKGRGSSCICYDVQREDGKKFILKEFYPLNAKAIRGEDNLLDFALIEDSLFLRKKDKFLDSHKRLTEMVIEPSITNFVVGTNDTLKEPYVSEERGYAYYIEDFYNGSSLRIESLGLSELLDVLIKTVDALDALHQNDTLYLDLKPSNIFYAPDAKFLKLFDFDSSVRISDIPNINIDEIGTTIRYAAPELNHLMNGDRYYLSMLGTAADFYPIGIILLEYLIGDKVDDLRRPLKGYKYEDIYEELKKCELINGKDPALIRGISEVCSCILSLSLRSRLNDAEIIKQKLNWLKSLSDSKVYFKSSVISSGDVFIGRTEELEKMNAVLQKEQVVCVSAEGGMGKSTMARRYAQVFSNNYDVVFTASYSFCGSVERIVENVFDKNIVKQEVATHDTYFEKRMLLRRYLESATGLLIIDDFDDIRGEIKFNELIEIGWKIVLTSRSELVSKYGETIYLRPLLNQHELFVKYYNLIGAASGNLYDSKDDCCLKQILEYLEGNTFAIELMARSAAFNEIPIKLLNKYIRTELANDKGSHDVENINRDDKEYHFIKSSNAVRLVYNLLKKDTNGKCALEEQELFLIFLLAILNIPRPEKYIIYKLNLNEEEAYCFEGKFNTLHKLGWVQKNENSEVFLRNIVKDIAYEDLKDKFVTTDSAFSIKFRKYVFLSLREIFSLITAPTLFGWWPDIYHLNEYLEFVECAYVRDQCRKANGTKMLKYCTAYIKIAKEVMKLEETVVQLFGEYNNSRKEIDFDPNHIHDFSSLKEIIKENDDIIKVIFFNAGGVERNKYDTRYNSWFWSLSEAEQNQFLSGMWKIETEEYKICEEMMYEVVGHYQKVDSLGHVATCLQVKPVCTKERIIRMPSFISRINAGFHYIVKWDDDCAKYEDLERLGFETDSQLAKCECHEYETMLGLRYLKGVGCKKDSESAVHWLTNANTKHSAYELGKIYSKGDAQIPRDIDKAIEYYKKAGNFNDTDSKVKELELAKQQVFKFDLED